MGRFLASRVAEAAAVLFAVATVTFMLLALSPGGPDVMVNVNIAPEDAAVIRRHLGLDQPVYVQYLRWLGGLARLDLGDSFRYNESVTSVIASRLPATLLLGSAS